MLYNRASIQGNSMPLLMGFTEPSKVEFDETPIESYYDPISQVRSIECGRMVGTRCLKERVTKIDANHCRNSDRKNEIDDRKYVP